MDHGCIFCNINVVIRIGKICNFCHPICCVITRLMPWSRTFNKTSSQEILLLGVIRVNSPLFCASRSLCWQWSCPLGEGHPGSGLDTQPYTRGAAPGSRSWRRLSWVGVNIWLAFINTYLCLPCVSVQIVIQVEVGAVARAPHEHPHVADHLVPGEEGGQRHQRREGGHHRLVTHAPAHIPGPGAWAHITSDPIRRYSE